jgi:3-methyladenine DNA glycosylase AlkD
MTAHDILTLLKSKSNPEKAAFFPRFFKSLPGDYGEGDRFLGVSVPEQRAIVKQVYNEISLIELSNLLQNEFHEARLTAVLILVLKFEKNKNAEDRKELVDFYLNHLDYVNNWDIVDSSCYKILGPYLVDKDRKLLYDLAYSDKLWHQRVAMITTLHFIKKEDFKDALALSEILLHHDHDLIHKAVGWMLREIGNKNQQVELDFLDVHYQTMPRTALRYAIEKFEEPLRKYYLKK